MDSASFQVVFDVLSIVMIDLVLAGDNAVVIAMAVQSLPTRERRWGITAGAAFAVLLRVGITFFAAQLLEMQFVKLVGGLLIFWIAVKMLRDAASEDPDHKQAGSMFQALWMIVVADITMSTDNILAVAAASKGSFVLLMFGLGLSIPFIVFTSNLLANVMERYRWIVWLGAAVLGRVGAEMIVTDAYVKGFLTLPHWSIYGVELAGALLVVGLGKLLSRAKPKAAAAG